MNKRIGFIGCGNMGKAMLGALVKSNTIDIDSIMVSTKSKDSADKIREEYGVSTTLVNSEVAKKSDILFLAVKPYLFEKVINEIKDSILQETIIVSIAAGITIDNIEKWFGKSIKVVRTMPNTPCLVGEGMSAVCPNGKISEEELKEVCYLYNLFGKYELLEEKDFHAFIALCGSSPAYMFVFIEAMADAAVKLGIPRAKAYKMAEQSMLGSAKLALETGKHPGVLKDEVCSPGGTTIEAVLDLEKNGFRNTVASAIEKCAGKSKSM